MEHNHEHATPAGRKLLYGIILSITILIVEVIGGLMSNSLALLSDAGHVLTDIFALGLSWYGVRQAIRPANHRMTFGYHRVGVIIAILNALSIFAIAGFILYEAYQRFQQVQEVNSPLMAGIAVVGLAANVVVVLWLRSEQKGNINVRSAFWHVLGDALASVGVIVGGLMIWLTGLYWIDPLVSVIISLIILASAWSILREGFHVILEATPKDVDVRAMIATIKQIRGVVDIHDVHVWSISSNLRAMNGHILIDDISTSQAAIIREEIEQVVLKKYHISHTTLQLECKTCDCTGSFCDLNQGLTHDKDKKPQGK